MSSGLPPNRTENPYAAPAFPAPVIGEPLPLSAEEQLLRSFVGAKKAYYYLASWRPLLQDAGGNTGFNWAAFLVTGFWLPFRKMYKTTLIFYAAMLVLTIAEEVVCVGLLGMPETPTALDSFISIFAAVGCGMYGNRWYLAHARRVIAEARAAGLEGEALHDTVALRGGTSYGAAFGLFFLFLAATFALMAGLELAFYE